MLKGNKQTVVHSFKISLIFAIALLGYSATALSAAISHLTYDANSKADYISDSLNKRDWLRWDTLVGKTLDETLALTVSTYRGWKLAGSNDAQMFIDALIPANKSTRCSALSSEGCWTDRDPNHDYHALVGDSFNDGRKSDLVFFQSHDREKAGYIKFEEIGALKTISKFSEFDSIDNANRFLDYQAGAGWLLYREWAVQSGASKVMEPATPILGLFALLLVARIRFKQAKRYYRFAV